MADCETMLFVGRSIALCTYVARSACPYHASSAAAGSTKFDHFLYSDGATGTGAPSTRALAEGGGNTLIIMGKGR